MHGEPTMSVQRIAVNPWLLAALFAAGLSACAPDPVDPEVKPPDGAKLSVSLTSPAHQAANVGLSPSLVIQFSAPVLEQSISMSISPEAALGTATLNADGNEIAYDNVLLAANTQYTVTVSAAGKGGEQFTAPHVFSFKTVAATDTAGPTLVSSLPSSGAVAVPANQVLTLTFSEPMDIAGLIVTSEPEHDFGAPVWSNDDKSATFLAADPLLGGQRYALTLAGADRAGNALQAAAAITFTVANSADSVAPSIIATTPIGSATGVSLNTALSLTFSEEMDKATVDAAVSISPNASGIVTWDSTNTLRTLQAKGLAANTQYTLTVGVGAKDLAGNPLAAPFSVVFTTGAARDTTPPQIAGYTPLLGSSGNARNVNITITFSEPMDKAATQAAFSITAPVGMTSGIYTWSADGKTMTFNPSSNFPYAVVAAWRLTTGAMDLAGNAIAAQVTRSFNVIKQGTLVVNSVGASDGIARSDGLVSLNYASIHAGETDGAAIRAFVTFNLSALPATTERITMAAVYLYQMQLHGDPAAMLGGAPKLERVNFGETLDASDFNVARFTGYNDSVDLTIGAAGAWRGNGALALGVWDDFKNRAARGNLSQYRVRLPNLTSAPDGQNWVSFYGGDSADTDCPRPNPAATGSSCKAHMIIQYEYP
jgi:hypothetical protein